MVGDLEGQRINKFVGGIIMGLITKEVEVGLNSSTILYYENLGYIIPRVKCKSRLTVQHGTKIKVNVLDLTNKSNVYVEVQCDNCNKVINVPWYDFKKCVHEDGKYYCRICAKKLYGGKNIVNSKLKNGKSFEQWCLRNNRQDVLDRWDYELNNYKPNDILYGTDKKYYFKCPTGMHESELKKISWFTSGEGSIKCNKCNSFAQWGINNICEDFLNKYWDYEKNIVDPWNISYCSHKSKVWIKCQEKNYHKSYNIYTDNFVNGKRCPYCHNYLDKIHPLDSLGTLYPEVLSFWSDKNKKSPYEYSSFSSQKVYWKCPEDLHNDYLRRISYSNTSNFRCPECNNSKGEASISKYFLNINFIKILKEEYSILDNIFKLKNKYYIPQKEFDDLIGLGGGKLSYDFYLPQYNLLIEYDGEFHYMPITKYKNEPVKYAEARLKKQQEHDRLKDEYAKKNNIKLLRIPYWDFDNIEKILDAYLK